MLIDDQLLHPYQIVVSKTTGCTIIEPTDKKDAKGITINKTHGYFNTPEQALLKVAVMKVIDDNEVTTIKDYVTMLQAIKNDLLTLISVD